MAKGIIVAATASGSGKTVITLGLLRALRNRGIRVACAKAGPDYIDPAFHAAASGRPCINLDIWAMGPGAVHSYVASQTSDADLLVVEGVMGLFDGPARAEASTADLSASLGLPVVLVVDASRQGQSIAAVAKGFCDFRQDISLAGIILNRVASDRHEVILRDALAQIGMNVIGAVRQSDSLALPSRHLGLIQAQENQQLDDFIEEAASAVTRETFIDNLMESARALSNHTANPSKRLPPPSQTIAIARDDAFSFIYRHLLDDWRSQGAEISFFSPLADDPVPLAGAVFLPGGYPELHAGKLAGNSRFLESLRNCSSLIYGECGGFMVLGDALIDATGQTHIMAGLLPLTTSFAKRKLHLGYRQLAPDGGPWPQTLRGHEFHYATIEAFGPAPPLFMAKDASGNDIGPMGQRLDNVMGSFAHVISVAP